MKKNLLMLMFVAAFICSGVFVSEVKASTISAKSTLTLKKTTNPVAIKLESLKSIIRSARANCMDCLDDLYILEWWAQRAINFCGADGANWNDQSCKDAAQSAMDAGAWFLGRGCGWMLPDGTVTAKNTERKIWVNRKNVISIS